MQNEVQICGIGIEIQNNQSKLFDNQISKSHEYGIQLVGDDNKTRCMPLVWRNRIEQCAFDGIIVYGQHCEPDIRGNIIANNRKSGIKLMRGAIAHIGCTSKEDIKIPDTPDVEWLTLPIISQGPVIAPHKLGAESQLTLEAITKESPSLDNKYFRN